MAIGDALTAPTGVQNQMVGQPSRVPGYDQGYAQAPGMPRPTQPNPMGRPTAVVGGPAYFTPEGYNAPPQPTQAFMPTDRAPDPIGDQFMRQMQSPMGQQYQQQYEAIQAPMREAEMAQRAEQQAAQDARFQEMMDRIAELEGQLSQPTEPTPPTTPMPGDDSFINLPDFLGNLDFSNLPDFSNIDYDDIMNQYRDRETDTRNAAQIRSDAIRQNRERKGPPTVGGPGFIRDAIRDVMERIEVPGYIPPASTMPVDEPRFTTMPVPDGPRGPGMSIGDMLEGRVTRMPVGDPIKAPVMPEPNSFFPGAIPDFSNIDFSKINIPDFQSPVMPTPAPAPQAPVPMPVPNYIPNIPNIDFSNLPKAGGRPSMDFSNLGNFNLR